MKRMLHPPRLQLRRGPRHRVEVGSWESEAGAVSGQGWSVVYDVTRALGERLLFYVRQEIGKMRGYLQNE